MVVTVRESDAFGSRKNGMSQYEEAVWLRAQLRARKGMRDELNRAIQSVLKEHGVHITEQFTKQLTIAAASEIDMGGAHVVV